MRSVVAWLLGSLVAVSAQPFTPDVDLGVRPLADQAQSSTNTLSLYAHGNVTTEQPFVIRFEPNAEAHRDLPEERVPWFFSTCTEGSYEGINYQGGDPASSHLLNNTGTDVLPEGYYTYMDFYQDGALVPTRSASFPSAGNAPCPSRPGAGSSSQFNQYAASEDVMLQPHVAVDVVVRLVCSSPVCEESPPLSHHFEFYSRAIHPKYYRDELVPRMVGGIEYTVTGSIVIEGISSMDLYDDMALAEDLSKLAADASLGGSGWEGDEAGGFRVTEYGFLVASRTRGFRFYEIPEGGGCVKHTRRDGSTVAAYAVQFVGHLLAPPRLGSATGDTGFYSNRVFERAFESDGYDGRNFKYSNLRLRPGVVDVTTGAICGRIGLGTDVPGPLDEAAGSVGWDLCGEPYEEVACPVAVPDDDDNDNDDDDDDGGEAGLSGGAVAGVAVGAAVGGAGLAVGMTLFFTNKRAVSSKYQEPLV